MYYLAFLMLKVSTYFIKAQIPGTTLQDLLKLYLREIINGGAGLAKIVDNTIQFSDNPDEIGLPRRKGSNGSFSGFSSAELIMEETDTDYEVYLEGHGRLGLLYDVGFTTLRNTLEQELQGIR